MRVRVQPRLQTEAWSLYWKESLRTETQASGAAWGGRRRGHEGAGPTHAACLDAFELDLPEAPSASASASDAGSGPTAAELMAAAAAAAGWPPAGSLTRLPGFAGPWERLLAGGRELPLEAPLRPLAEKGAAATGAEGEVQAAAEGGGGVVTVTLVRVVLKADGWKIRQPGDFLSDSDDEA
ncbi:hypothetical protein HYH03_012373 [Edaphochlamys debaryana]|uniref:Uncharacterized protein n=1 Tax=Edaphochlamys debaryana TaxID=47281 RepID=A0A836BUK3_9CHLO|nr:hypothetical protein HYH03_012373 [Edaphochlamys debaryana]|eukprot:KAG2489147.1 hypothetical protein HYH03_012373 [Edaphochlamys debaryana]